MHAPTARRRALLEPIDRSLEILFGLIMVLTFTGSLSVAESGREDVRTMIIGALGCNLAWGIVDAAMYLMESLVEQWRKAARLKALRDATSDDEAHAIVADALPPIVASVLTPRELQSMRERLLALPEHPRPRMTTDDWLGAVAVFLLVFLSTFPVVIPFILFDELAVAMRTSNAVAVALLFFAGYSLGRSARGRGWGLGIAMVVLGLVLVAVTIALGG